MKQRQNQCTNCYYCLAHWKERCNFIFLNITPRLDNILSRAKAYCEDYFKAIGINYKEFFKSHSSSKIIYVYTDAAWNIFTKNVGLGFIVITNPSMILLARSMGTRHDSPINAECDEICQALQICRDKNWIPNKLCCDFPGVAQLIQNPHPCIAWISIALIKKLKNLLKAFPNICISTIPRKENTFAEELTAYENLNSQFSLFFRGLKCPNWIEELCFNFNLFF